jgi:hypothetical protein
MKTLQEILIGPENKGEIHTMPHSRRDNAAPAWRIAQ